MVIPLLSIYNLRLLDCDIISDYELDFITKVTFVFLPKQILSYRYHCPVQLQINTLEGIIMLHSR